MKRSKLLGLAFMVMLAITAITATTASRQQPYQASYPKPQKQNR
jgi:hypothetical protein